MSEGDRFKDSSDVHEKVSTSKNISPNLRTPFKAKQMINNEFKKILKNRPHPELEEQRLLLAVTTNNTEKVQKLLESGVSANSTDRQKRSALHLAASRGYIEIVKLLLHHGADPNKQDIIQNTPLHLAACINNLQIVTLLLNAGADVRSLDIYGRNPLQLAESKLQLLQRSWREGAIEMVHLRSQLQMVVDVMISMWKRKQSGTWGHHRENIDDLELVKLSLIDGPIEQVDDTMSSLLNELQQFSIK